MITLMIYLIEKKYWEHGTDKIPTGDYNTTRQESNNIVVVRLY